MKNAPTNARQLITRSERLLVIVLNLLVIGLTISRTSARLSTAVEKLTESCQPVIG